LVRRAEREIAPPHQLNRSAAFSRSEHCVTDGVSINVNLSSVSKTVRGVSLASLILFIGALGSCYVGEQQWEREEQETKRQEATSDFVVFDGPSPETNNWQIAGGLGLVAGVSLGIAAFMLGRQER
jgi:hypothetical protein